MSYLILWTVKTRWANKINTNIKQSETNQENHVPHDLPQDFLMHLIYSKAKNNSESMAKSL